MLAFNIQTQINDAKNKPQAAWFSQAACGLFRGIIFVLIFPQSQVAYQRHYDSRPQCDRCNFQGRSIISHGAEIIGSVRGKIISGKSKYVQYDGKLQTSMDYIAGKLM